MLTSHGIKVHCWLPMSKMCWMAHGCVGWDTPRTVVYIQGGEAASRPFDLFLRGALMLYVNAFGTWHCTRMILYLHILRRVLLIASIYAQFRTNPQVLELCVDPTTFFREVLHVSCVYLPFY